MTLVFPACASCSLGLAATRRIWICRTTTSRMLLLTPGRTTTTRLLVGLRVCGRGFDAYCGTDRTRAAVLSRLFAQRRRGDSVGLHSRAVGVGGEHCGSAVA